MDLQTPRLPRTAIRALLIPTCLALAAVLSGCASTVRDTWFAAAGAGERSSVALYARSLSDPPVELESAGPLAVDITSFGGSIEVIGNPKRSTVLIQVVRRGTHGSGRGEESRFALDDIKVSAVIGQGDLGQALIVRAETTEAETWFLHADLRIEVPEIEGLRVHNGHGPVRIRNAAGKIDITTHRGSILLASDHPLQDGIQMSTDSGDIDCRLPAGTAGSLDLMAHRGTISPRIRRGQLVVQQGTTNDRFVGVLNGGDQPVVLRTVDGTIRFAVVDTPLAHGRIFR